MTDVLPALPLRLRAKLLAMAARHGISPLAKEMSEDDLLRKIPNMSHKDMSTVLEVYPFLPVDTRETMRSSEEFVPFAKQTLKAVCDRTGMDPVNVAVLAKAGYPIDGLIVPEEVRDVLDVSVDLIGSRMRVSMFGEAFIRPMYDDLIVADAAEELAAR